MKKTILITLLMFSSLFAHKLNLFTSYENGALFVSTYFANGKGCKNCKVVIKDKDEKILFMTETNRKGELSIKLDKKEFIVSVDAGGGHIVSDFIKVKELKKKELALDKDNELIEKLKSENQELNAKVKSLEEKLDMMNIYKTIFALLIIALIFLFLKRVKSE